MRFVSQPGTSILFFAVATQRWHWRRRKAGVLVALFLVVDLSFFGANISKIAHGAWFPLVIGAGAFLLMTTWDRGRVLLTRQLYGESPTLATFLETIRAEPPVRVPGTAVYLAGSTLATPPALLRNLEHNHILHAHVAILTLVMDDVPYVPRQAKVEIDDLGQGFHRLLAHFGFMEEPNVPYTLALAREQGLAYTLEEVSFFLGREQLRAARLSAMPRWRRWLFMVLARNALDATAYFRIPPERVVELGAQVAI